MYTYMHNFPAFNFPYTTGFTSLFATGFMFALIPLFFLIAIWTIIIKGYALWHAARNGQKWWFVALLVINTFGILEIIYLIWFRPTSSHASTPEVSSSTQA